MVGGSGWFVVASEILRFFLQISSWTQKKEEVTCPLCPEPNISLSCPEPPPLNVSALTELCVAGLRPSWSELACLAAVVFVIGFVSGRCSKVRHVTYRGKPERRGGGFLEEPAAW